MKRAIFVVAAAAAVSAGLAYASVLPSKGLYKGAITSSTKSVQFKVVTGHVTHFKLIRREGSQIITLPVFDRVPIHKGRFSWTRGDNRIAGHWVSRSVVEGTVNAGFADGNFRATVVR
jgi:hypothetical protein